MAQRPLTMTFGLATTRRLASAEQARRFREIIERVAPELAPTHVFYWEGRGGKRALDLDALESLYFWTAPTGGRVELPLQGPIRGQIMFRAPQGHEFRPTRRNWISTMMNSVTGGVHFSKNEFDPEFFGKGYDLFGALVRWSRASFGYFSIGPGRIFDLTCLPPLDQWINVLGPEYVEMLGRERLLGLDDVYKAWEDDAGRVWLQMSESPEHKDDPAARARAERIKQELNAEDVFCREPRTADERRKGVDPRSYRTPDFDWSELVDNDPYSTKLGSSGIKVGRHTIRCSRGFSWRVTARMDLFILTGVVLKEALRSRSTPRPVGAAIPIDAAEQDPREAVLIRTPKPRSQEHPRSVESVLDRLKEIDRDRPLRAIAVCSFEETKAPGRNSPTPAFRIHYETSSGDPVNAYLPVEEKGNRREYGILLAEPGVSVFFARSDDR